MSRQRRGDALPPTETEHSEEALQELVRRARSGDPPAAYDVLGRQVPVATWVQVLQALARNAPSADLELIAHRTLRRPPAVVAAVLELARAAGSPKAAFLARVIGETRDEERIRSDALELNRELVSTFDVEPLLAGDEAIDALYALLARTLADQKAIVAVLGEDTEAFEVLSEVARAEYERLQEVARDTRWRTGSYRHALRHALANLALLAGMGGRFEDQAFRLLQQRTEAPQANAELIQLVSEELRARYLEWSLDRSAAESSPERALFALSELSRYPAAVDRATVRRLVASKDDAVAAAASMYLVESDATDGAVDPDVAELLSRLDDLKQRELVEAITRAAPERIRLDLWPLTSDQIVAETARGSAAMERLAGTLRDSADLSIRLRVLHVLGEMGDTSGELNATARAIATSVLDHARPPQQEIDELLRASWLRDGTWAELPAVTTQVRERCLEVLIAADPSTTAWSRLGQLHEDVEQEAQVELERSILEAVADEQLSPPPMFPEPCRLVEALQPAAEARVRAVVDDLSRLASLVALGDRAAETELATQIEPLVRRAVERVVGNDQLVGHYRALVPAVAPSTNALDEDGANLDAAELEAVGVAIKKAGVQLVANEHDIAVTFDSAVARSPVGLVRAIALIDQRIERASTERARSTAGAALVAVARETARVGVAEEILSDLFEHGQLFQAAVALSPRARGELLRAAVEAGFAIPDGWRDHDQLGVWLIEVTGAAPSTVADSPDKGDVLRQLQRAEGQRRELEDRLKASRLAARRDFVRAAARPLDDLEQAADVYAQFWLGLARIGIHQIAALGQHVGVDELDPERHELVGTDVGRMYVVRSAGLEIGGEIVRRARLEAVE